MEIKLPILPGVKSPSKQPKRSSSVDQRNPKGHYVYAHVDASGGVFYIGKGVGQKAWSKRRRSYWDLYVERHLKGSFAVEILEDSLTEEDVEYVEDRWISYYGPQLINWVNINRRVDLDAIMLYKKRRDANKERLAVARQKEKTDLEHAASIYIDAIKAISTYAFIDAERGLLGQLTDKVTLKYGYHGNLSALNRLTLCLIKLGRVQEAAEQVDKYFTLYRADLNRSAAKLIRKRITRALNASELS
jgi:hypothetical protein